ncbi:hypothetical protein, partial [Streptococcus pneumoniae]|uniref:hypothetical protein n=1 Tax=Streptococcus pneumoniae TaxID=1313 RepID=UPI0018B077CF
ATDRYCQSTRIHRTRIALSSHPTPIARSGCVFIRVFADVIAIHHGASASDCRVFADFHERVQMLLQRLCANGQIGILKRRLI